MTSGYLSMTYSFSLDQQRSLETDFWIFLTVSFFIKVLEEKMYFSDIDQVNKNTNNFSSQQLKVGAFLTRILRVSFNHLSLFIDGE